MDTMNIIVLNAFEEVIAWLIPDKCEIVETNKEKTIRTIQITYPLEEGISGNNQWFQQGNKIFIPATMGIESCLYVINSQNSIDYWDGNKIVVKAEEVLTELNYAMFEYTGESELKVTKDNLASWFGDFYQIGTIDTLNNSKNTIAPAGTMTKMSLLRLIEEQVEYVFTTKYTFQDNKVTRTLSLRKPENIGSNNQNYFLDLNFNMESLELDIDESDTYNAMAPVISLQNNNANTTGTVTTSTTTSLTSTNNNATGDASTDRETLEKILTNWKNLNVGYREKIPMIIESTSDGKYLYKTRWYAPFVKEKGSLYIYSINYTNSTYQKIVPMASKTVTHSLMKIGTVQTSEKDHYAIYNALAEKLLEKLAPKFTLKVSLKDIQEVMGLNNLGYKLYDTIYVRVPGFDYYVKGKITETKKNLHLPGENTITIENDVTGNHLQKNTIITSSDIIVNEKAVNAPLSGTFKDVDGNPIKGSLMNISITLEEAYNITTSDSSTNTNQTQNETQAVLDFKPAQEQIIFSDNEIQNMAKIVHNYLIDNNNTPQSVNMRASNNKIYRVSRDWYRAIYYARNAVPILAEYNPDNLGKGKFFDSIAVEYHDNIRDILKKDYTINGKKVRGSQLNQYWACWFYTCIQEQKKYIYDTYYKKKDPTHTVTNDPVTSSDLQNKDDCGPTTFSNVTENLWDYKTEYEMNKVFGVEKGNGGLYPTKGDFSKISKLGYTCFWVDATWENMKKYSKGRSTIVLSINSACLKRYQEDYNYKKSTFRGHVIYVPLVFEVKNGGKYVYTEDSNYASFIIPGFIGAGVSKDDVRRKLDTQIESLFNPKRSYLTWDEVYDAIGVVKVTNSRAGVKAGDMLSLTAQNKTALSRNKVYYKKQIFVVQLNNKQKKTGVIDRSVTNDKNFNPNGLKYQFNSNELVKASQNLMKTFHEQSLKKGTVLGDLTCTITDVNGKTYTVTGKWIFCMLYAYAYNYRESTENSSTKIIDVGVNTNAMWYYNTLDSVYNWTSLTYSSSKLYNFFNTKAKNYQYFLEIMQHILFLLKLEYHTLLDIFDTVQSVNYDIVKSCEKYNLNCFLIDVTSIKEYITIGSIAFVYITFKPTGSLLSKLNLMLKSTSKRTNVSTWHGVISKNKTNTVNLFIPFGNGNSPTNRPRILPNSTDAKQNPFISVDYNNIIDYIKNCSESKNKAYVITTYTKEELKKVIKNRG